MKDGQKLLLFPLPDEVQDRLSGSTVNSMLALQSGEWQMADKIDVSEKKPFFLDLVWDSLSKNKVFWLVSCSKSIQSLMGMVL